MSDDAATEAVDLTVQEVEIVGANDWFLQSIVETVITLGVEMGVTFTVGGTVVSGILISGLKYFEELGDSLSASSQADGDVQSVLGKEWKRFKEIYEKPSDAPDDWQPPRAAYVHLRNARYYAPGSPPIPSDKGLLWRGKISSIDGFSFGNFQTD